MPVYEYECSNESCAHRFEEKRSIHAKGRKRCPKCRHKVEQIYSPAGIHFKGTGWYVTDYKNKTTKPQEKKVASVKDGSRVSQSPGQSPRWASD